MATFSLDNDKTQYTTEQCFSLEKTKGRPRKVLNDLGKEIIRKLASFMCTEEEIAGFLGCTVETLKAKWNESAFLECLKVGRDNGKTSLRMAQFKLAKSSSAMAIFLGKQYLGQKDTVEDEQDKAEKEGQKSALNNLANAINSIDLHGIITPINGEKNDNG